jgi:hypothetical protein
MKIKDLEQALDVFEKKAIKHDEFTRNGESSSKINYQYNGIIDAVKWINKNDSLKSLNKFYNNSNLSVRSWAASFLLEIDTNNAEKILETLVLLNDFNSKYILLEWKAGTLNMDFFKE